MPPPTPHYRIEPISRGSMRNGKVRRAASLGGSMAGRIIYITRGGDLESRTDEVISHGFVGPQMGDWSCVDHAERRKDAIVGRELVSTVPHSLHHEAMDRIGRAHAEEISELLGVPVYFSVHRASRAQGSDWRNTHIHFDWPSRQVNAAGKIGEKTRILDNRNSSGAVVAQLRAKYQDLVNRELAAAGLDTRLDLRSFAAQGLPYEAQTRVSKLEYQRARRGEIHSPRYARNQALIALRTTTVVVAHAAANFTKTCRNIAVGIFIRRRAARTNRRRAGSRGMDCSRNKAFAACVGFSRNRRDGGDYGDNDRPRAIGTGIRKELADTGPMRQRRGDSVSKLDAGRTINGDRSRRAPTANHAQMAAWKDGPETHVIVPPVAAPEERSLVTKMVCWFGRGMRRGTVAEQVKVEDTVVETRPQIEHLDTTETDSQAAQEAAFAERITVGLRTVAAGEEPVIKITTRSGAEYYMRRLDWQTALATSATDVSLCQWHGEPFDDVAGKRKKLRVSTVEKSELLPVKPASMDDLLHREQEHSDGLEL